MLRASRQQPVMATVKSRLAQLLAQEDIKVQHLPVKTALFDMKNRVLVCPIWKDMDGDLYDLCMGHEVGHALNTPEQGWHGALKQMGKGYQTYMNVVEDARIERKIKTLFPGLRAPFARAYMKLDERDMFEIRARNININKLGLIDRINIYYKLGHIYPVQFTDEERGYLARIERADTWEQVREIADELYARAKKRKDMLPQLPQESPQSDEEPEANAEGEGEERQQGKPSKSKKDSKKQDKSKPKKSKKEKDPDEMTAEDYDTSTDRTRPEDDENEYDDEDESDAGGDSSDAEGEEESDGDDGDSADAEGEGEETDADVDGDDDGDATGESDDEQEESDEEVDAGDDHHDVDDDDQAGSTAGDRIHDHEPEVPDPKSITDEAFRQNEEKLVDENASAIRTLYLPDTKNVKDMIAPMDLIYTSIEDGIDQSLKEFLQYWNPVNKEEYTRAVFAERSVKEIVQDNKKYIDLLVKEFELRKNASEYKRQLTAKTGELDVNNLHKYRFTNDLFKKITSVQKGKSHGMLFFLDMSSSMMDIMGHTVRQLLVLVTFCKRVGIPFDVYGYADGECVGFSPAKFKWQHDTIRSDNRRFHLKHLISSSCRGNEYRRAFAALAMFANIFYGQQSASIKKYLSPGNRMIAFSERRMNMILSGTPYNKMLLASRQIIEDFRAEQMVDIVNVIHLTDGDGTDPCVAPTIDANEANYQEMVDARIAYTDRKTQVSIIEANHGQSSQEILTQMIKRITGCRHIAFYVGTPHTIESYAQSVVDGHKARVEAEKSAKEFGFFRTPHLGYDSYYYVGVSANRGGTISDNTYVPLEDRFIKAQHEKVKSRNMARQFCSEIAEQIKRED